LARRRRSAPHRVLPGDRARGVRGPRRDRGRRAARHRRGHTHDGLRQRGAMEPRVLPERLMGDLRERVFEANRSIVEAGLVVLTFGNASAVDRDEGVMAIKPSGVPYGDLGPSSMVIVDLESGEVREGGRPSSDTPTHLVLYRAFEQVGGIVHTHSPCATAWAQARREIPCVGTTHADHFRGPVPVTRTLSGAEI